MAFNFARPTKKVPVTRPGAKKGKRTLRSSPIKVKFPGKGQKRPN